MKKLLFIIMAMAAYVAANAAEGCAAYDASTKTLTFYYDSQSHSGDVGPLPSSSSILPWWVQDSNIGPNVEKVVFDSSFAGLHLTSGRYWFSGMKNLTNIVGLNYFNTDQMTTMQGMFYGCSKLKTLNLSSFDTRNVTNMYCMFQDCSDLTAVNLSSFQTDNVTNMAFMFYNCSSLAVLDVTPLRTNKVTTMENMFSGCKKLTCLDLSSFNTYKTTDMTAMFSGCSSLVTIYVDDDDWGVGAVTESNSMFRNCTSIVGNKGTTYDANHIDKQYAHIDLGPNSNAPGYMSRLYKAYAVFTPSNSTLTFYFDNDYAYNSHYLPNSGNEQPGWHEVAVDVRHVVFDRSFADVYPLTTSYWFADMEYLTSITGLEYLNTSQVTNMCAMFYEDRNLESIDLSRFETGNVENMSSMFQGCHGLTSLDLRNFDTRKVGTMAMMFEYCDHLVTIAVGENWSTALLTDQFSYYMFSNCNAIRGSKGTRYDANHTNHAYAHIDGGPDNPGYLSDTLVLPGDVNADGRVNVSDVTVLINMILGITPMDQERADVNGDGRVNVSDVTALINIILGIS